MLSLSVSKSQEIFMLAFLEVFFLLLLFYHFLFAVFLFVSARPLSGKVLNCL